MGRSIIALILTSLLAATGCSTEPDVIVADGHSYKFPASLSPTSLERGGGYVGWDRQRSGVPRNFNTIYTEPGLGKDPEDLPYIFYGKHHRDSYRSDLGGGRQVFCEGPRPYGRCAVLITVEGVRWMVVTHNGRLSASEYDAVVSEAAAIITNARKGA